MTIQKLAQAIRKDVLNDIKILEISNIQLRIKKHIYIK
ncbi:hypothetical protein EDD68_1223 [Melghiribacillus thermohalophilus]|uniref:Uncharacterized protein n=1 Tax=Melghiribacillus thermohalophilus TaxID=1324956 RepID=A0A4R3MT29_9BACI|nr:hypothetical protein EDD68_1223 [Melghiribacillus thermohalophilus]